MTTIGSFQVELVFSLPEHRTTGSAIVPPESIEHVEAERSRHNVGTAWEYDDDPESGERREAFRPIEGARLSLITDQGIRHGDRFMASFDVKEVTRQDQTRREMWLVDSQPCDT